MESAGLPPLPTICRKRSAVRSPSPEFEEDKDDGFDNLKRTKTDGELEALGVTPLRESWPFDVADVLKLARNATPSSLASAGHLEVGKGLFVLCIVGEMILHYESLAGQLSSLRKIAPNLQAVSLVPANSPLHAVLGSAAPLIPVIPVQGRGVSHFLKLGLLHPLGGGQHPLDAIVVIDARGRKRLVIPFGWGAGRHVREPAGGDIVVERLMNVLNQGIRQLEIERGGSLF